MRMIIEPSRNNPQSCEMRRRWQPILFLSRSVQFPWNALLEAVAFFTCFISIRNKTTDNTQHIRWYSLLTRNRFDSIAVMRSIKWRTNEYPTLWRPALSFHHDSGLSPDPAELLTSEQCRGSSVHVRRGPTVHRRFAPLSLGRRTVSGIWPGGCHYCSPVCHSTVHLIHQGPTFWSAAPGAENVIG